MTPAHLTATLPAATTLITAVREKDGPAIHRALFNCPLPALAITLAHLVPDDRSTTELLAWTQPGAQYKRADGTDMRDDPEPAVTGDPGGKCGTVQGYNRHIALDINVCKECKKANTERQRRTLQAGETCGTLLGARRHNAKREPKCQPCQTAWDASLSPCGTYAAARRHKDRGETTCEPCSTALRDYDKERDPYRRRRGTVLPEHGSHAGYQRHKKLHEKACEECLVAERAYDRERRARRRDFIAQRAAA